MNKVNKEFLKISRDIEAGFKLDKPALARSLFEDSLEAFLWVYTLPLCIIVLCLVAVIFYVTGNFNVTLWDMLK